MKLIRMMLVRMLRDVVQVEYYRRPVQVRFCFV